MEENSTGKNGNDAEGKIHADEDWKKSVEEERERLREEEMHEKAGAAKAKKGLEQYPEANFQVFLAGLYTQTLMALGLVENPVTGAREKTLPEAQYLIDTIDMLKQKTKGNLTDQEADYIENLLYNLRMRFVEAARETPQKTEDEQAASGQS